MTTQPPATETPLTRADWEREIGRQDNRGPVRFSTSEEWEKAAKIEVSEKVYCRKSGKKKERHRIVHVMPSFTGSSESDLQNAQYFKNGEVIAEKEVILAIPRLFVEKFNWDAKTKVRTPLSSFLIDTLKFMEEFEAFPEEE